MKAFDRTRAVFRREFRSYFDSPVAYVFLTAFLVLTGFLTFCVAMLYERRQADLSSFFFWIPWVCLLLVPSATMGLWADERRSGTIEQLLTFPITALEALAGKFLAAWAFLAIALALTFPVAATVGYLGSPDWGAVACGYAGSLLLLGAAAAVGLFASTLSKSGVVGFVIAFALLFLMLVAGFEPVSGALARLGVPIGLVDAVAACSLLSHFEALGRGVVDASDVGFYIAAMAFFVFAAKTVVDGRRGAAGGVAALACVGVIAVSAVALLSAIPLRADLTQGRLYTLSDGSRAVLGKLDTDVALKFYVSSRSPEMPSDMKSYARQVRNLLREYERAAGGRLELEIYDPEPDSDAEEWAQRYGVEPQTVTPFGSPVYFGLVAVSGDREETLGVISRRTESTLEYDITRLVTRVAWPERPVVGVMTSLKGVLGADEDPMTAMRRRRAPRGWAAFAELAKDYDVRPVETDAESIDPEVKTLVVLHAKDLSAKTLYAIDQFVLRGGRLIACVDPLSVADFVASGANQFGGPGGGDGPSTLGALFDAWGVRFEPSSVVCDLAASTALNDGMGGVDENPAFLTLGADNLEKEDVLVTGLSRLLLPFAGSFSFESKAPGLVFEPVASTSTDHSCDIDRMAALGGMSALRGAMKPDGTSRVVAARLSGSFPTAFPSGPDGTNAVEGALSSGSGSVLLVGDSDFVSDDFCVRVLQTPFGAMLQPLNDNLSLFSNMIEQFAGREELIGIRTRGASDRPFEKVDALETRALARWQSKEEELRAALEDTQRRLSELERQKSGSERRLLSPEQQSEIAKFRQTQADTRRQLKNVRKELTADIDALGLRVKCLNIALVPALVALFGIIRGIRRRRS